MKNDTAMPRTARLAILLVVTVAASVVLLAKREGAPSSTPTASPRNGETRPRLLELGSVTCVPCRMMETVLESLRQDHGDRLDVDFIDVSRHPEAGHEHRIRMIPTQIFFAPGGEELFRHEGFYAEEEILAKWRDLGYPFESERHPEESSGEAGWIDRLFRSLTEAVQGSWGLALGAALAWGVLSILLSPCHLASIPLIVGFIDEQGRISTQRAFLISTLFATGILVTIAVIGAATAAAGRMMGDVGAYGNLLVAVIFFGVGLHLVEVIPNPFAGPGQVEMGRRGMLAAFLLGLVFGLALGPCTFAYMAPLLAITFREGGTHLVFGAALLLFYGIGHCSVIIVAGTCTEVVQRYLNWNERSGGALLVKRICGGLVLLGGLYMLWTA